MVTLMKFLNSDPELPRPLCEALKLLISGLRPIVCPNVVMMQVGWRPFGCMHMVGTGVWKMIPGRSPIRTRLSAANSGLQRRTGAGGCWKTP